MTVKRISLEMSIENTRINSRNSLALSQQPRRKTLIFSALLKKSSTREMLSLIWKSSIRIITPSLTFNLGKGQIQQKLGIIRLSINRSTLKIQDGRERDLKPQGFGDQLAMGRQSLIPLFTIISEIQTSDTI
jgi:hypothetical protein